MNNKKNLLSLESIVISKILEIIKKSMDLN